MALTKRVYVDGETIITAQNLNDIQDEIISQGNNLVPKTRTVNNKALSANITLSASDVSAVPTSRKVNNKALSSNVTISASDVPNDSTASGENVDDALDIFKGISVTNSPYYASKISIIGDSMSTYNGEIYTGYSGFTPGTHYPAGDVTNVNQTWWMQVINSMQGTKEVNASFSGARVSKHSNYASLYDRVSVIGNPDIVFIALGYNDYHNGVSLGDYDFTTAYTSLSDTTFRTAVIKGLKALQALTNPPKIVWVLLTPNTLTTTDARTYHTYRESIIYICRQLGGIQVIDATPHTTHDNTHPDLEGMRTIANSTMCPYPLVDANPVRFHNDVRLRSALVDLSDPLDTQGSVSQRVGSMIQLEDLRGYTTVMLREIQLRSGEAGLDLIGRNIYNGSMVNNYLRLTVTPTGTKVVDFGTGQSAWLTALGLYSPTILTPTLVSPLPTGITSLTLKVVKWGCAVYVQIDTTFSGELTSSTTVVSGEMPIPVIDSSSSPMYHEMYPYNTDNYTGKGVHVTISSAGNLVLNRGGAARFISSFTYFTSN